MWWSRLTLFIVLLALGPSACGFRPMYGNHAYSPQVTDALEGVFVAGIEDRLGQQLRNALVQRINPQGEPGRAEYELQVKLDRGIEGLGHRKSAIATLGRMNVTANYLLIGPDGTSVLSASSRSFVSFNYLGPRYASIVVERDAEERAVAELAEDIRRRLMVYFTEEAVGIRRPQ